jgi:hypothetical protein
MDERSTDERDRDRTRLWELVELLQEELSGPQPDWQRVRTAAAELRERVQRAAK